MDFLNNKCTLTVLNKDTANGYTFFDCGDNDLNEFFEKDCHLYSNELLGKSYCFKLDSDDKVIVCAFTLSNDSIRASYLPNSRRKKVTSEIPQAKQMKNYPAVLIGRLGVSVHFRAKGVGDELMNFIKAWFIDAQNKTGCRYIVVDAYNKDKALNYYVKNGFQFIFSTEKQEREYTKDTREGVLTTRLMYFDLITLKP